MTEGLAAMVTAMWAEIRRQQEDEGLDFGDCALDPTIDMEKVARAGLAAIREPTPAMSNAGRAGNDCGAKGKAMSVSVIYAVLA